MRYAIYFTPGEADPLTRAAERWIGRSAFSDAVPAPLDADLAFHTASARRYGFHATLKAPFRLTEGRSEAELVDAFDRWTAARAPFVGPRLVIGQIDGFFALVPESRSADLDTLARDLTIDFDAFRAPAGEAEIARRNPESLTTRQVRHLHEWGYPYVMEDFRFHMTLTGRVGGEEAAQLRRRLEAHFGALLDAPVAFASLALFVEPEPGAPFTVRAFRLLGRNLARKTA
ncbi:DUF1045 domain-containing protein [Aliihoeflea sp. 2WW]|uniref:DUF1045 domain-containing protein n=1 Tax=Aliihoeflea sp. 2WW TaxID=1381123 RepID=UPI000465382D|nr:DUF1045 domain-containing protein [Aliihoeflea sp. 2WW]